MNIGVIGTGYVGLVTSVCLAHVGHRILALDKRAKIIEKLSKGEPTIYEDGLAELLAEGILHKRLEFTCDIAALKDCDIVFLAVGTPPLPNGSADLSQLYEAVMTFLPVIEEQTVLAVRSTIPVGTMTSMRAMLTQYGKNNALGFCPEFLREGIAISDFLNPQRVVIASDTEAGRDALHAVYAPLTKEQNTPYITCCEFESAEIIKYASNVFLAMKITFTNQIAQLAQNANANIYQISKAMGLDSRIGTQFLQPSPGYGGSCFPKDTMALVHTGLKYGVDMSLVEEVHKANIAHQKFVSSWVLEKLGKVGLHGNNNSTDGARLCIAVWGLAFKANTDDVRDSAALTIIKHFVEAGFAVQSYDPKGGKNFMNIMTGPYISIKESALASLDTCCALVVLTEWEEFMHISPQDVIRAQIRYIFDTRNILDTEAYRRVGATVYKLGMAQA